MQASYKTSLLFCFFCSLFLATSCRFPLKKELTDAECKSFGDSVIKKIKAGKSYEVLSDVNAGQMTLLIAKTGELSVTERVKFTTDFVSEIGSILSGLSYDAEKGNRVDLLRVMKDNERRSLLIATRGPNGVTYYEFRLGIQLNKICIDDIFLYTTGEWVTHYQRELLLFQLKQKKNKNLLSIFTGTKDFDAQRKGDVAKMKEAVRLASDGDLPGAWELFNSVPDSMQRLKAYWDQKLNVAIFDSTEVYYEVVKQFIDKFPGDRSHELYNMFYYRHIEDSENLAKAIEILDTRVKDPYLDWYRAEVHEQNENYEEKLDCYKRIVRSYPDAKNAYYNVAYMSAYFRQYDSSLAYFNIAAKKNALAVEEVAKGFLEWGGTGNWIVDSLKAQPAFQHLLKKKES